MKIAILKTDTVRSEWSRVYGEYPDMFVNLLSAIDPELQFVIYDVQQQEYPESIDEADAYLITGSKVSAYDDIPWIRVLEEFIRDLHRARKKFIGICFGHQLVAQALGGRVEKAAVGWGVGRHRYELTDQTQQFAPQGTDFHLLASHQDQVLTLPADGRVLASSEFCPVAAMAIAEHGLTFQGHPEFVVPYAQTLLNYRRDLYGDELYQQAQASFALPTDHQQVGQWIVSFLRGNG